jgi:hypothetical protein
VETKKPMAVVRTPAPSTPTRSNHVTPIHAARVR